MENKKDGDKKQSPLTEEMSWGHLGAGLGVIVLFFVVISALGGDDSTPRVSSSSSQPTETNRCLDVPAKTLDWISSGLVADDLALHDAKAVRSNDFEKVYMVSARLTGEGLSGDNIATFATNNLEGSGLVLAVSGHAKQFTDWFEGDREGAQFHVTINNDGASESRDCVR